MDNVEQMGQLIAELSKFGGMPKGQASKLARILLPYIEAETTRARNRGMAEGIKLVADVLRSDGLLTLSDKVIEQMLKPLTKEDHGSNV